MSNPLIAIVGAGPAGLYAAQRCAELGLQAVLLNRDIKPGGLAEYGIYYDKYRVKDALRRQFCKILDVPEITYYGNVTVGEGADLSLDALRELGFPAILVAVGAQGTKWLGLPGEDLDGVYHAKDVIYHYNGLPSFSQREFEIGERVALIGVGNVMADIAHWLVRDVKVDEVIAVARRGPAEVKFTRNELAYVARNLDVPALDAEIARVAERMEAVDQDPEAAKAFILSALSERALPSVSDTRVRFRFLSAPRRILGDGEGHVAGLEVDNTELYRREDGTTKPRRRGTQHVLDVDTVIFCIGDRVSEDFGLPVEWNAFVKHPEPCYPVEGTSYEAYDPGCEEAIEGVFVAGWARKASEGQVGLARKDARRCVAAVQRYLTTLPELPEPDVLRERLAARLAQLDHPVVTEEDLTCLLDEEAQRKAAEDLPDYKFRSNAEMLAAMGLADDAPA